jgi:tetratricopeptide (TPR) repeat protein
MRAMPETPGGGGGTTREAHLEPWRVLDLLASLIDKNLVLFEPGEGSGGGTGGRYRLTETVRRYAQEKLFGSEEAEALRERHARLFLALAEEANMGLGGPDQVAWLDRLETEHDNLRAAVEWFGQAEDGREAGLRLTAALQHFWLVRGHLAEGREHLGAALARADARKDGKPAGAAPNGPTVADADAAAAVARARALSGAGLLATAQGDYGAARAYHEEALALFRASGHLRGVSACLGNLGNVAQDQGDYAAARAFFEQGLAVQRELGDEPYIALSLGNLGSLAHSQGDLAAARTLHEESLALRRRLGDPQGIAGALNNLAKVLRSQGDIEGARALYEESLFGFRRIGHRQSTATVLQNLADLALLEGDLRGARSMSEESLALRREIGDRAGIADGLGGLGDVAVREGDYATARALYDECLGIQRELGNPNAIAYALYNLGDLARKESDPGTARRHFAESTMWCGPSGDPHLLAHLLEAWADLGAAADGGQSQEGQARAARLLGAAAALREEIGLPRTPAEEEAHAGRVAAVRAALGEAAFAAAWDEGWAMSLGQAVESALEGAAV